MRRVLLIGATSPTGLEILAQAKAESLSVLALARNPERLQENNLDVVRGDVLDAASLVSAMSGIDVVMSVLGTPLTLKPVSLLSRGTQNVVDAMRAAAVTRLLCVTGMGAGDSRGHGGFVYDRLILPTLLRQIYADKDRQERIVRDSQLDWTLVRPARLTDSGLTGKYREITDLKGERMTTISRKDVAHFMVKECMQGCYRSQTVNLTD